MSKKKKTQTITGQGFSGTSALSANDIENLSVDGFGNPAETLLQDINWSGKIVAMMGLRLSPDNLRVTSSSLFLLGSLFKEKRVFVTKTWTFLAPTSLTLSIPNANIFTFQNGNLYSDYLDSSACTFSFSQNGSILAADSLASYNCKGFCLRAHLAPISGSFLNLWITLYPFSKDDLLAHYPAASNPAFPGLKVLAVDIPFAPLSSGPP